MSPPLPHSPKKSPEIQRGGGLKRKHHTRLEFPGVGEGGKGGFGGLDVHKKEFFHRRDGIIFWNTVIQIKIFFQGLLTEILIILKGKVVDEL